MEIFDGIDALSLSTPGSVVTLGVFDGVHLGHQAVIERTVTRGHEKGLPAIVVTFRQHPAGTVGDKRPRLIMSLRHRLTVLARHGLDAALVLDFTPELAGMSARDFTQRVFVDGLRAGHVVLGFDCRFGRKREGDARFLERHKDLWGLEVESVEAVEVNGQTVSSTLVRELVARRDLEAARAMLGRPYSVLGTVVRGSGLGEGMGFPTANLDLEQELTPPAGVYVGRTRLREEAYPCLVSIGDRPTFARGDEVRAIAVEVYLLDFSRALYGEELEVEFLGWVRAQEKFPDGRALSVQMERDREYARRYFAGDLEG